MTSIALGFALQPVAVELDKLLPSKKLAPNIQTSRKYLQIKASIEEIGLIEPLAVTPAQEMRPRRITRLSDEQDGFCRRTGGAGRRRFVRRKIEAAAQDQAVLGKQPLDCRWIRLLHSPLSRFTITISC